MIFLDGYCLLPKIDLGHKSCPSFLFLRQFPPSTFTVSISSLLYETPLSRYRVLPYNQSSLSTWLILGLPKMSAASFPRMTLIGMELNRSLVWALTFPCTFLFLDSVSLKDSFVPCCSWYLAGSCHIKHKTHTFISKQLKMLRNNPIYVCIKEKKHFPSIVTSRILVVCPMGHDNSSSQRQLFFPI